MGCTNTSLSKDLFFDMTWGISENGVVQLTNLLPLDLLYSDSHNPGTIGKTWKKHHDSFADFIKKSFEPKKILEIGASSGLLVNRFLDLDIDFTWDIVEPSSQDYLDNRINHYQEIFEDFSPPTLYDVVIHSHLFEHVYNPVDFLLKVNKILKIGGNQFVSVPNLPHFLDKGYSNGLNFEHTFFYDQEILDIIFESCGFLIVDKIVGDHSIFFKAKKVESLQKQKSLNISANKNSQNLFQNYINLMLETVKTVKESSQNFEKVYLFGGHIFSQSLINLGLNTIQIEGILDNDPLKENLRLYGTDLKVFNPSKIKNDKKTLVVVKAGVFTEEITNQLIEINNDVTII
jgi:2-polyprenyl-3-methyl-5-hydroxy-6-metoxy-1,4-benzoquinol methylase